MMHLITTFPLLFPIVSAGEYLTQALNFYLSAVVPSYSPLHHIDGWNLTSYHIAAGYDYAVLAELPGRILYESGTDAEFDNHTSQIYSDGGTPPWPWGVYIQPNASESLDKQGRRHVSIVSGSGTPGIQVNWLSYLWSGTGQFYACNATLPYGPAITLYFREAEQETPEECSDVFLKSYCLVNGTAHEHQRKAWCQRV